MINGSLYHYIEGLDACDNFLRFTELRKGRKHFLRKHFLQKYYRNWSDRRDKQNYCVSDYWITIDE